MQWDTIQTVLNLTGEGMFSFFLFSCLLLTILEQGAQPGSGIASVCCLYGISSSYFAKQKFCTGFWKHYQQRYSNGLLRENTIVVDYQQSSKLQTHKTPSL